VKYERKSIQNQHKNQKLLLFFILHSQWEQTKWGNTIITGHKKVCWTTNAFLIFVCSLCFVVLSSTYSVGLWGIGTIPCMYIPILSPPTDVWHQHFTLYVNPHFIITDNCEASTLYLVCKSPFYPHQQMCGINTIPCM
jgi:hypothetical protein